MVWFICGACGDSIKKPKVDAHARQCGSHSYTCIDCSLTFDLYSVRSHNTCVTEHEKYALGATKPGGYASHGHPGGAAPSGPTKANASEVVGEEHLTTRPPWKCTLCNVNCTSQDTLLGHATGTKHIRKVRAVQRAANGEGAAKDNQDGAAAAAEADQAAARSDGDIGTSDKENKGKEGKETKSEEKDAEKEKKGKVKWPKLAKQELKRKGKPMKLSKLVKRVLSAAGDASGGLDAEAVMAKLRKTAGKEGSGLAMDGELIELAN